MPDVDMSLWRQMLGDVSRDMTIKTEEFNKAMTLIAQQFAELQRLDAQDHAFVDPYVINEEFELC